MHKVAVVQAGSVPFDAEASVDKAIARLREAAGKGAELVVFPEAFIGGYPKGSTFGAPVGMRTGRGRAEFERYFDGAVTVDGPEVGRLAEAAHEVGSVICWENYMPLLRQAMYAKGVSVYCAPTVDVDGDDDAHCAGGADACDLGVPVHHEERIPRRPPVR